MACLSVYESGRCEWRVFGLEHGDFGAKIQVFDIVDIGFLKIKVLCQLKIINRWKNVSLKVGLQIIVRLSSHKVE